MPVFFFFNEKVLLCLVVFFTTYFWLSWLFLLLPRAFRGCSEALLSVQSRASHTAGFSCGPGLQACGSAVTALTGLAAPRPVGCWTEPVSPALAGGVLHLWAPRKSSALFPKSCKGHWNVCQCVLHLQIYQMATPAHGSVLSCSRLTHDLLPNYPNVGNRHRGSSPFNCYRYFSRIQGISLHLHNWES